MIRWLVAITFAGLSVPAWSQTPGEMQARAFDALTAREGGWAKIGAQYTVIVSNRLVVCGAGYNDSLSRKFMFVFVDGRMVLSTDRGGEYETLDRAFCHPDG